MKHLVLVMIVGVLVGCGKKEPVQSTESKTETTKQEKGRGKAAEPTSLQGINQTSKVKVGTPIWEFVTGRQVNSSPAIGSDGTFYVGSGYGNDKLYAINGKTGVKLWEFETESGVRSSPAIGSDGTVYVGSFIGKLYAIKTDSKGLAKSPWPMRGQNARHTGRVMKQK